MNTETPKLAPPKQLRFTMDAELPCGCHMTQAGDRTLLVTMSTPQRVNDLLRGSFMQAGSGASFGEETARRVAYWVQMDLERRYPDAVNARCVAMAGERLGEGILAVTWMRGREVFHRRHSVDAMSVGHHGAHHFASYLLPAIIRQIESTEGAERP